VTPGENADSSADWVGDLDQLSKVPHPQALRQMHAASCDAAPRPSYYARHRPTPIPSSSTTIVTDQFPARNQNSSSSSSFFLSTVSSKDCAAEISKRSSFSSRHLFQLVSLLFLVLTFCFQYFFLGDGGLSYLYSRRPRPHPEPTSRWTARTRPSEIFSSGCCKALPTYLPHFESRKEIMPPVDPQALIAKAEAVARQFEFGPDDVRKGVKEFIREMGTQIRTIRPRKVVC
jgi:hypothetical protein